MTSIHVGMPHVQLSTRHLAQLVTSALTRTVGALIPTTLKSNMSKFMNMLKIIVLVPGMKNGNAMYLSSSTTLTTDIPRPHHQDNEFLFPHCLYREQHHS
jgi:hypothetical protein